MAGVPAVPAVARTDLLRGLREASAAIDDVPEDAVARVADRRELTAELDALLHPVPTHARPRGGGVSVGVTADRRLARVGVAAEGGALPASVIAAPAVRNDSARTDADGPSLGQQALLSLGGRLVVVSRSPVRVDLLLPVAP